MIGLLWILSYFVGYYDLIFRCHFFKAITTEAQIVAIYFFENQLEVISTSITHTLAK